jgi:hypothetical protein
MRSMRSEIARPGKTALQQRAGKADPGADLSIVLESVVDGAKSIDQPLWFEHDQS